MKQQFKNHKIILNVHLCGYLISVKSPAIVNLIIPTAVLFYRESGNKGSFVFIFPLYQYIYIYIGNWSTSSITLGRGYHKSH